MNPEQFEYEVEFEEITPPIGKTYRYTAKVPVVVLRINRTVKFIKTGIGEVWGETKEDARLKIETLVQEWINRYCKKQK